jgi:hypothetical protein
MSGPSFFIRMTEPDTRKSGAPPANFRPPPHVQRCNRKRSRKVLRRGGARKFFAWDRRNLKNLFKSRDRDGCIIPGGVAGGPRSAPPNFAVQIVWIFEKIRGGGGKK